MATNLKSASCGNLAASSGSLGSAALTESQSNSRLC